MMNEDLLQDLVLYKKSHEKAILTAARSLVTLFREICPSLLVKKDRGRPTDPKARPKAFGEFNIPNDVPDLELLQDENDPSAGCEDEIVAFDTDSDLNQSFIRGTDCDIEASLDAKEENVSVDDDDEDLVSDEDGEEDDDDNKEEAEKYDDSYDSNQDDDSFSSQGDAGSDDEEEADKSKSRKRKLYDYVVPLSVADTSLRALKRLAESKTNRDSNEVSDGILSNEDFQQIKAKKKEKLALARHGLLRNGSDPKATAFKLLSSEQLSMKHVDPATLEVNIKRKMNKEERLAMVKAGREDRGEYKSRVAVKKKTGGVTNRQKEHKKLMPLVAKSRYLWWIQHR